jgi:hypothetical protein
MKAFIENVGLAPRTTTEMIDPSIDLMFLMLIGMLVILAFFVAVWPMDKY